MNWQRGLFRLWLFASAVWVMAVVGVALLDDGIPSLRKDCSLVRDFAFDEKKPWTKFQTPEQLCDESWRQERIKLAEALALPPIITLLLGAGFSWVARGFRRSVG